MNKLLRALGGARASLFFAALLFAIPFWFGGAAFCSLFGAVALFFALFKIRAGSGLKRFFRLGFWFGFCYHALIYHWLFALYPFEVANLSKPVAVLVALLAYFGASVIHALFFALAFLVWGALGRRCKRVSRALLFIVLFVLAEYLKEIGTLALPWTRVALPLANYPITISVAALIGPYGVDLILLLFGAAVVGVLTTRAKKRVLCVAALLAVLCFDLGFGIGKALFAPQRETVRVAVVQTDYPISKKWDTDPKTLKNTLTACALEAAGEGAEWIVFPESVLAASERAFSGENAFFAQLSKQTGAVIVAGTICEDGDESYNAVAVYDKTGMLGYNGKRHLVPFGEYLPWQSTLKLVLPDLADMTFYRNSYTPGQSGICGTARGVTAGGLTCFDSIFPVLARESANEGAQILFVCTNDSWFKTSGALQQHLWQAIWRAAETDRAVAQAANTGISALISLGGQACGTLPAACDGVLTADLELCGSITPYAATGDLIVLLCFAAALCFAARRLIRSIRERRGR